VPRVVEKKSYDGDRVHLSLAGRGDPWSSLTKLRKRILRELHDIPDINELASLLEMKLEDLMLEIQPLMDASLVFKSNEHFRPSFLVTDAAETQTVYDHACEFSKILAEETEENISDIKASYHDLELSNSYEFDELALMFVGGRILDIKLLDTLSKGNRVMPPAPSRPSQNRPNARYYFFMVEGDSNHLGGYGQDDSNMPWEKWHFITFGQNIINGKANIERRQLEERYSALINEGDIKNPEGIGEALDIPVVFPSDSTKWSETSDIHAEYLCQCFEEHEDSIKSLHADLKSGRYAPHSLGEFFCWYAHIVYASAIDILDSKGIIYIPPSRFQAAVWYRERENEGMLSEL